MTPACIVSSKSFHDSKTPHCPFTRTDLLFVFVHRRFAKAAGRVKAATMLIAFPHPGANFSPSEASVCRVNSTDKCLGTCQQATHQTSHSEKLIRETLPRFGGVASTHDHMCVTSLPSLPERSKLTRKLLDMNHLCVSADILFCKLSPYVCQVDDISRLNLFL